MPGAAVHVAAHHDAARHREERQEQQDERDVFQKRRVQERLQSGDRTDQHRHWNEDQQAPESRDFSVMMLPGVWAARRGNSAIDIRMPTKGSAQGC